MFGCYAGGMKLIPNLNEIDRQAIEVHHISGLTLMETAGRFVAEAVQNTVDDQTDVIVIICGRGNNGGDGYVCARLLKESGYENIVVLHTHELEDLSGDAKTNFERLSLLNIECHVVDSSNLSQLEEVIQSATVIVDALFGSGLTRNVEGLPKRLIELMNYSKEKSTGIISADLPSGIDGATGQVMGVAVNADKTVTFATGKPGLYIGDGKVYSGKVDVVDIGIPQTLIEQDDSQCYLVSKEIAKNCLPDRTSVEAQQGHKYTFGHVLVLAGSQIMPGAACLATHSAMVSGAGLVSIASPQLALDQMPLMPEVMRVDIDSRNGEFSPEDIQTVEDNTNKYEKINTILIGPGLGVTDGTTAFFENLMYSITSTNYKGTVVIDADGLNCLAKNPRRLDGRFILTPHIGEAKRLLDDKQYPDTLLMAQALQDKFQCQVVLKSSHTITATTEGKVWVNSTGCNALATAGSGDVLAGLISGLCAQTGNAINSAKLGVYLHGLAGEIASEDLTPYCVTASRVVDYLPEAFSKVLSMD